MKRLFMTMICVFGALLAIPSINCDAQENEKPWLNPAGMTVETRFVPPTGFTRKQYDDPYTDYMRKLPMLPDGSPVHIFTGALKETQSSHVGVLDIDVPLSGYQECSDAAQRIRTDYLFQSQQFDKINYRFVNGMQFPWDKYKQGYRTKREGKKTVLVKSAKPNDSAEAFKN